MAKKPYSPPVERVRQALKDAGINQEQLAEKLDGVSKSYISQLVRDKKPLPEKRVRQIAEITGVRPEYLLCIDDYRTEEDYFWSLLQKTSDRFTGFHAFLDLIAHRFGASISVKKTDQKQQGMLCMDGLQQPAEIDTFIYTIKKGSVSVDIPESDISAITNELLDFAEWRLYRVFEKINNQREEAKK